MGRTCVKFQVLNCPSLDSLSASIYLALHLGKPSQGHLAPNEPLPSSHPNLIASLFPSLSLRNPWCFPYTLHLAGFCSCCSLGLASPTCLLISASKTQSHIPAQQKCCPFSKLLPEPQPKTFLSLQDPLTLGFCGTSYCALCTVLLWVCLN